MLRKTLVAGVFAMIPLAGGCSDDPPSTPFGPGALAATAADGGTSSGAGSSPDFGGGGTGADAGVPVPQGPDAAANFRDPRDAGDGGCSAPNMLCDVGDDAGPKCIAIGTDVNNCGKCGNACQGPGATCIAGSCACTGALMDYCDGQGGCMDVSSDVNNCGACGNVCDPNQFNDCVAGTCVSD